MYDTQCNKDYEMKADVTYSVLCAQTLLFCISLPLLNVSLLKITPGPPMQKFSSNSKDKSPNSSLFPLPACPVKESP